MPRETEMIAHSDHLVLMVTTKEVGRLVEAANELVERVIGWMDEQGMELAAEKTGIVVTARRRKLKSVEIRVQSRKATKYLGVWIDKDLRMTQHVKKTVEKVDRTTRVLDIPSSGKMRTLVGTGC